MALKERLTMPDQAATWPGELPVQSLYTAGVAGDRFLKALRDKGQFLATRCQRCNEVYVPARLYCEKCLAGLDDWVELPGVGTVESWTEVFVGLDGEPLAKPQLVGLIQLEGATTSLIHRLEVPKEKLVIGMKVKAALKPAAKREGAITDIIAFRPA